MNMGDVMIQPAAVGIRVHAVYVTLFCYLLCSPLLHMLTERSLLMEGAIITADVEAMNEASSVISPFKARKALQGGAKGTYV